MKIKSTRQRGCFFVGWKASADQGEAPSISPMRGSAWLPLEILERLYWSSEESDGSDQSDKQLSQQNLGLVRPVRLVREYLKPPEKLTGAFLLKDGEILWVVLSAKISAVFFLFRERKNWPKSCGKRRFRGLFAFFSTDFDKTLPYPLRRSPYCVGERNKDVSRQPYCADKYNKEKHAQEGGIVRSLPLTKTFEPFSEAENKNCIDKEQKKRPARSRRCSMAGRYVWYLH